MLEMPCEFEGVAYEKLRDMQRARRERNLEHLREGVGLAQAARAVGVSKRAGKVWRNGRTRLSGRDERALVDRYSGGVEKPKGGGGRPPPFPGGAHRDRRHAARRVLLAPDSREAGAEPLDDRTRGQKQRRPDRRAWPVPGPADELGQAQAPQARQDRLGPGAQGPRAWEARRAPVARADLRLASGPAGMYKKSSAVPIGAHNARNRYSCGSGRGGFWRWMQRPLTRPRPPTRRSASRKARSAS